MISGYVCTDPTPAELDKENRPPLNLPLMWAQIAAIAAYLRVNVWEKN